MSRLLVLLVLTGLLLASPSPITAQEVVIGDQLLMRLDTPEQADAVARRIQGQLERGVPASEIKVVRVKGSARLVWGTVLIVEVTPQMAASKGSDPAGLAALWAATLRDLAGTGLLRLSPARLVMPVGEDRPVEVGGLAQGSVRIEDPNGLVACTVNDADGTFTVRGLRVGKTRLEVSRGSARTSMFIHVKDWAGTLPEQVEVQVAGNPAPGSIVADAVLREAYIQARVRPGCSMVMDADLSALPSIPRGQIMRINVPVKIDGGENYYPVQRNLPVAVNCLDLKQVDSNLLLVSNRPESVDQDGILLSYTFRKKEPTRLMYSHQNGSREKRNLWVNLANPNRSRVRVLINWVFAGPARNEVLVGHSAALRLMEREADGAGYVLTFPPGSRLELAAHELAPLALVSGFANFRILEGESLNVEVRTRLAPGTNDGTPLPHLGAPFNPFKIHPHGVFAQPFFEEEVEYPAGAPPRTLTYGESPWLIDFETGLPNTGNFGVLYRYELTLKNPRPFPARLGLFFVPVAGPAAGTVLVDGKIREVSFRKPDRTGLVDVFDLGPGQTRTVEVMTLPEASSNYPASLRLEDVTGRTLEFEQGSLVPLR